MRRIFISYRRQDSQTTAKLVAAILREKLAPTQILLDVDMLRGGEIYENAILDAVRDSDVVLVLIGPGWVQPRLASGDDLLRREVETAITRPQIRVIPVLHGGASMPRRDDVPRKLSQLCDRHAFKLHDGQEDRDLDRLVAQLRGTTPRRWPRVTLGLLALLALLSSAGFGAFWMRTASDRAPIDDDQSGRKEHDVSAAQGSIPKTESSTPRPRASTGHRRVMPADKEPPTGDGSDRPSGLDPSSPLPAPTPVGKTQAPSRATCDRLRDQNEVRRLDPSEDKYFEQHCVY